MWRLIIIIPVIGLLHAFVTYDWPDAIGELCGTVQDLQIVPSWGDDEAYWSILWDDGTITGDSASNARRAPANGERKCKAIY